MFQIGHIFFFVCAAIATLGAIAAVSAKNPIRGAMGLLAMILAIAGLFLALHAQFLAAIQLIVYAGAIVVLFLFVIMLLGPSATPPRDDRGLYTRSFSGILFGLAGAGAIFLVWQARVQLSTRELGPDFGSVDAFGRSLFADALIPFELSSALLMVAVLGAIAIARGTPLTKAARLQQMQSEVEPDPEADAARKSAAITPNASNVTGASHS